MLMQKLTCVFLFRTVIDVTYPTGHIILSLLVLLAFNVTFGCIAGLLTMIEVMHCCVCVLY